MHGKPHHVILLVDDEESIAKALQRLFRREHYDIRAAHGGEEALRVLQDTDTPFSLIVSDQRMPGMSGVEFLERAKILSPLSIRILLTGYSDVNAIVDAVNRGQIHRYMTKPWNDEEMLLVVRQSIEQYELVTENLRLQELTRRQNDELTELNRTLEKKVEERSREILIKNEELTRLNRDLEANLYNAVKAFSSLVERYSPALAGHGRRVAHLSREIAKAMQLPEKEVVQIEIAALLHDFGKLSFPQKMMDCRKDQWTAEERRLYQQHPLFGQETVHFISRLDHVGLLIRSHHERYDGQGFPDRLSEEEIPVGSRIVAVADAYDRITNLRIDPDGSVKSIRLSEGRLLDEELYRKAAAVHLRRESFLSFDPDVVKLFLNLLRDRGTYREDRKVSVQDIVPGMVLARPLYSTGGRFLLPAETVLTENFIRKIRSIHETDFIDALYVIRK
ncbi:MAG TPA: response regulator [Syntrophales bacterium]|nr:response regulator [Syntrophales bacterium]